MTTFREIVFENNSPKVYYSGQLLKGRVNVYFPKDTHVKEIYITFFGSGFCRWTDGGNEPVTGSRTYLDARVNLLPGSPDGDIILPAGNNSYPFEVQLLRKIPTSYEGTYGYIRYTTTLHINRSAKKIDPLKEIFTVINPLNLNNSPSYRAPMEVRKVTNFNQFCILFCWKTDDLEIFGRLPVRGYCPGQTMNLVLDVRNNSLQSVQSFLVHFVQEVTYTANNGQQKVERVILVERRTGGCVANPTGLLQTQKVNILVPSLPPTNFSADVCGCRYMFVITAQTSTFRTNPTFEIPVVIGTYPISSELYMSSSNERSETNQTALTPSAPSFGVYLSASNTSINSTDLPPYPDEDPPTYEEAIRSDVVVSAGNDGFLPKYPTYRRPTTYASAEP